MPLSTYRAFAPGKLFLLGEHAVLQGYPAIVCAIDRYIHVTLTQRPDKKILITSSLGQHNTHLDTLCVQKPFEFVLSAITLFQEKLSHGFELQISAEFPDNIGFGSSAAVTVATLKVLATSIGLPLSKMSQLTLAKQITLLAQQGMGSGADIAASVYGGVLYFDPTTLEVRQLLTHPPLTVLYTGYKTRTPEVIEQVKKLFSQRPKALLEIYQALGELVPEGAKALEDANWKKLGLIFKQAQTLLCSLGVSDEKTNALVSKLENFPGIWGAKLSGSGLGDCVIGVGEPSADIPEKIPVLIAKPMD